MPTGDKQPRIRSASICFYKRVKRMTRVFGAIFLPIRVNLNILPYVEGWKLTSNKCKKPWQSMLILLITCSCRQSSQRGTGAVTESKAISVLDVNKRVIFSNSQRLASFSGTSVKLVEMERSRSHALWCIFMHKKSDISVECLHKKWTSHLFLHEKWGVKHQLSWVTSVSYLHGLIDD